MDKYLILLISFLLFACTENNSNINVAVASNFEKTLATIIEKYNDNNDSLTINIISASSGTLTTQIVNHAPFDLFLSADIAKPKYIYTQQNIKNKPRIYAIGKLALWIPAVKNKTDCLKQLSKINTLAIANPDTAPYGKLAVNILKTNDITIDKLVQTANVSQAYLYTKDNLVQAGFVPVSMLKKQAQGCIQTFETKQLSQSMILLNNKASKLYHFILSKEIQTLIKNSGYNTEN